jgi:hypothetical protein
MQGINKKMIGNSWRIILREQILVLVNKKQVGPDYFQGGVSGSKASNSAINLDS